MHDIYIRMLISFYAYMAYDVLSVYATFVFIFLLSHSFTLLSQLVEV
jgi:hypothetical protein